jgi:hypothetical protein
MDDTDLDAKWELFLEQQGTSIQEEIYRELESSAHLFDSFDGTHAKWSGEGLLGLLLVFDETEAEALLAAFQAGVDGIEEAQFAFAAWATSLMGLIRQCLVPESD